MRGFNPCFSGSCSRIIGITITPTHRISFNPCFSGSCSRILFLLTYLLLLFSVSILVLVDLAHESFPFVITPHTPSFNPCFSGSCSRIHMDLPNKRRRQVSILVLVDLAHEYCLGFLYFIHTVVSILVLVDLAHEFSDTDEKSTYVALFQSLF